MTIDSVQVPEVLRPLVPYARFWGEPDDEFRSDLIAGAPSDIIKNVATVVARFQEPLQDWLLSADPSSPTNEYIAFSNLLMVFHDPDVASKLD